MQLLDSGIVEVFGVGLHSIVEYNTLVLLGGFFNFLIDDNLGVGQVIHNFDRLIRVEAFDHIGDLMNRDHLADCSVKDGLNDVGLNLLSHVDAKSFSKDSVDLGLVDELIADLGKVPEEVLGDIDFILLLVVSVGGELLPVGIAGARVAISVLAVVATGLGGIGLGKRLVVRGEVDGLAEGGQASDRELSSHG